MDVVRSHLWIPKTRTHFRSVKRWLRSRHTGVFFSLNFCFEPKSHMWNEHLHVAFKREKVPECSHQSFLRICLYVKIKILTLRECQLFFFFSFPIYTSLLLHFFLFPPRKPECPCRLLFLTGTETPLTHTHTLTHTCAEKERETRWLPKAATTESSADVCVFFF